LTQAKTRVHLIIAVLLIATVALFGAFALYRPGTIPSIGSSPSGLLSAGNAWCAANGQAYPTSTGPPSTVNCTNLPVKINIQFQDLYFQSNTFAASGNNPSLRVFDSLGNFQENVLNCNSCTTARAYPPGTALVIQVCDQTTACASSTGTSSITSWYTPIPGYSGGPGGTVPYGPSCSTPPCTLSSITLIATAAKGTYTITSQFTNGTALAASTNIRTGTTWANGPFGLGNAVTKGNLIFRIDMTRSVSATQGYGWNSFQAVDTNSFLQAEFFQSHIAGSNSACQSQSTPAGSDMPVITGSQLSFSGGSGAPSGTALTVLAPGGNKAATWQVYGVQVPDAALGKYVTPQGYPAGGSPLIITVGYNVGAIQTASDQVDVCTILYFYFNAANSGSGYAANGSANSEAVSMATFGFGFKF